MVNDPLAVFDRLGRLVEQRWRAKNYDGAAFPDIAAVVLAEERPDRVLDARDLLRWVLATDTLPQQFDRGSKFGQPPLTMYRGPRFLIDALFWMDGTVDIHQHGFSGAFQVLAGSSVHSHYRFELEDRVSAAMLLGEVRFERFEILNRGDTRPIRAGAGLIHALFHLERPSVSLVIRTYEDAECGPQYLFHPPSLAIDPFLDDALLDRRLEAIGVLADLDPSEYEREVERWIEDADLLTVFRIARHYLGRVTDLDRLTALLERARPRHGARIDRLPAVLEEIARLAAIKEKRKLLKGPEHRFFLALLMNLPTRSTIFDAVRLRFGDADPADRIAHWVEDLAGALGDSAERDHTPMVLSQMLRGFTGESLITRLKEEFDDPDVEAARDQITTIERSLSAAPMLRSLFVD